MKNQKWLKYICVFAVLLLLLTGCDAKGNKAEEEMIEKAVSLLEQKWVELYEETEEYLGEELQGDWHFEIKNTRVAYLNREKTGHRDDFKNIKCVIEFDLYTNSTFIAPYYHNEVGYCNVAVNDDGTMEVRESKVVNHLFAMSFETELVDSVSDYGDKYNCVKNLYPNS